MPHAVNLAEKFTLFDERWSPKIVGDLNGQHVKLAKIEGEFVWHQHDEEDELFLVVQGEMQIEFRDHVVTLKEGEFCIVPRQVEHRPIAATVCHILLFEPQSTLNTGNITTDQTVHDLTHL